MEEEALYRAILAAPHDDAARLVYADWLEEAAERFPPSVARAERARAEFVRVQCKLARTGPGGWWTHPNPIEPALAKWQKRLLFRHGKTWRRAFPAAIASSPFDRGFLRPFRSLRPQEFLGRLTPPHVPREPLPLLPAESPARRYVPDGDPFALGPLWDVHLFASDWQNDPLADRGQYGDLLAEVARSPALARVGWLKVSFFATPVYDFLRTGDFANVETLVLNAGPFPDVLLAVAENESFRSLRYVQFGNDRWAWAASYPAALRYLTLLARLREANGRHLPHGEMRGALRTILRDTPLVPAAPVIPPPVINWTPALGSADAPRTGARVPLLLLGLVVGASAVAVLTDTIPARPASGVRPADPSYFKMSSDFKQTGEMLRQLKQTEELLRTLDQKNPPARRPDGPGGSGVPLPEMVPWERPPEAPPPRPVEGKDAAPEEQ